MGIVIIIICVLWFSLRILAKVGATASNHQAPKTENNNYYNYKEQNNITATNEFSFQSTSQGTAARFVVDNNQKRIIVSSAEAITEIPYDEVAGCEIFTNSAVSGGIGRAFVGGAIAGDTGAIIGAATAKEKIQSYKIVIYRNNIQTPSITISLIVSETKTDSFDYHNATKFATNVNASIKAIIAQNTQQAREVKVPTSTTVSQPSDIQSRLAKLDNLKSSGVITTEEYEEKRKKIIDEI